MSGYIPLIHGVRSISKTKFKFVKDEFPLGVYWSYIYNEVAIFLLFYQSSICSLFVRY